MIKRPVEVNHFLRTKSVDAAAREG